METTLSSAQAEVTMGPGHSLVLIGERINPVANHTLGQALIGGDFSLATAEAAAQVEAGAHMVDLSANLPGVSEAALLAELVTQVQESVSVPLSIFAASPEALSAALTAADGKPLVNGLSGDRAQLDVMLPIVAEHGTAFVGMCSDDDGIPATPGSRFAIAERIIERAVAHGIDHSNIVIDPVVMPIGARKSVGQTVLDTLMLVHDHLGVNTICGVSNISIGLPNRSTLNAAFLAMLIARSVPAIIANPVDTTTRMTALAADMFMGRDENSERWLLANRRGADIETRRKERQQERAAKRRSR